MGRYTQIPSLYYLTQRVSNIIEIEKSVMKKCKMRTWPSPPITQKKISGPGRGFPVSKYSSVQICRPSNTRKAMKMFSTVVNPPLVSF